MFLGASAVLVASTIEDCRAPTATGGGIAVISANVTLIGSRVERCDASDGGAMGVITGDLALLDGSVLSGSSAARFGGGLH